MCNPFATTAGLCGWALLAILTQAAEPSDGEDDLPAGVVEREVTTKPSPDLGKFVELRLGDAVVGTRQYFDGDRRIKEVKRYQGVVLHGAQRTWHRNGKPETEVNYRFGTLDGACRSWDESGELLLATTMVKGAGVMKTFSPKGGPLTECPYKYNKKNGVFRRWHADGALSEDTEYLLDQRDGWSRQYFPSGRLKLEAFFRDDKAHGVLREWNEAGDPVNTYGLAAKDTPADYSSREETPHYYIKGERVSKDDFVKASESDPDLRRSLDSGR